ncbi:hypothetical protein ANN_09107 [Periplaneta americana]|uniref:Polyprenal reductase n=1 Tax=Periplaneta americana TaxID=6978 RepID=A0ABQ8TMZ7_PERAM|nr:hypothetical protein ANN_09107 [Periplaneta americana]
MMELNLLKIGFSFMTIFVVVTGCLINNIEKRLPVFIRQTLRHGKYAYRGRPSRIKVIEVPKSWFRHFYVFASVYSTLCLVLTFGMYFLSWELPSWMISLLDFLASSNRKARETINIRYPPQNWFHLYTDGSLISREQGAGAGVTCCLFSFYRSLGYGTSFDGEITVISESLRNLLCHINKFKNAVILSDSKAAILSIVSRHTPSSQTAEITKMLSQLITLNKRIVFQWIPSHCGILGNENADALAKKGSIATYRPVTKSTYYSVKRFIKSTYLDFNKQNLITQSQGKKWNSPHQNPQLIPDLPRKSSVAAFRLATGHDCLAKHLHRIGIYQSPNCPLCNSNQEMDSEHLKICASVAGHDNIFDNYWSARRQMTLLHHHVRSLIATALKKKSWTVEEEVFCLATNGSSRRIDIIAYSQTTKKGYIIDPTIRIETGSSQPEDVNQEKINFYLPTVDYFKAKYQLENIEVIGLLLGARGVIPKFFESFRKTFELPQTLTADIITIVLKRSCQILMSAISSLLALSLLTLQSWRRFYETWFVSVFSNGQMNWSHYVVGFVHYFGAITAIIAESPGFIDDKGLSTMFQLKELTLGNIYGCVLFLWASYHQYKAAVLLADLRKNKNGSVVTLEHRVPHGDWFELVSSPHNLTEIMMYLAMTFILWGSDTWPVVFLWVLSNQVETAMLTHWWYKSKFEDYPAKRKAIIPYVL